MAEVKLEGLPELRAALRELPARLQKNALRNAIQAAAKLMAEEVKSVAPIAAFKTPNAEYPAGSLRRSVKARRRRGTPTQVHSTVDMLWYGRLIEKGWMLTGHKPGKAKIRHIPGRPFVLPAFERARKRAIDLVAEALRAEIKNQPIKEQIRQLRKAGYAVTEFAGQVFVSSTPVGGA